MKLDGKAHWMWYENEVLEYRRASNLRVSARARTAVLEAFESSGDCFSASDIRDRKLTRIGSVARNSNECSGRVDKDKLAARWLSTGLSFNLFVALGPDLEQRLSCIRCCEVVVLHAALEICWADIGQETALRWASTGGAIQDIGGYVLGSECRFDLGRVAKID